MTDSIEDKNTLGNQNEEAEQEEKRCLAPNTATTSCDELTDQKESKIDLPKDEDEIAHEPAENDGDPSITQVVFGNDDRTKVDDPTRLPYKYVCRLVMKFPSDWWWISNGGTGWICNTGSSKYDVVVTAAHNLVVPSKEIGGAPEWATSVTVIPACDGTQQPFGEYKVESQQLRASVDYLKGGQERKERSNYDFGAILIPRTGILGQGLPMLVMNSPKSAPVTISGYPGSGGPNGKRPSGYQWKESGSIEGNTDYKLVYSIDTSSGQSGSPILLHDLDSNSIVSIGIHRGDAEYNIGRRNDGIWITEAVENTIKQWGQ